MPAIGTSVWTGRAVQAGCDDLEITGLAHLYSALKRSVFLLAIMDIRTHPFSFASGPWKAGCATRSRIRRWDRFSISSIQLADLGGNLGVLRGCRLDARFVIASLHQNGQRNPR